MTAAECRVEVLPSVGKFIKLLPNPYSGLCNPFLCSTGVKYIYVCKRLSGKRSLSHKENYDISLIPLSPPFLYVHFIW